MASLPAGKQFTAAVAYTKSDGSPGSVEGAPVWELSNVELATLTVAEDGMSATIAHNGAVGSVTLTVTADGDLGAGVFPIVLSETIELMAPEGATAGTIAFGEPTDIPA